MAAYFVTATGTDIGKTFVTAGLVRHLRARNACVSAVKPVMSGYDAARAAESDAGVLLAALGREITPEAIAAISPWRFAAPLSPDMAAAREGRTIDFAMLVEWCKREIGCSKILFIEGIGGVMVPLDECHTVLDWMKALGLPLILVAGSYLGTISHTLTAIDVCERNKLRVAALVVSESEGNTAPLEETVAVLERFAPGVEVLGLRRRDSTAEFPALWRALR